MAKSLSTKRVSEMPAAKGTYVLAMQCCHPVELGAGSLGLVSLKRGWYLYVGSALGPGGLRARCGRHLRQDKSRRCHLDYLRNELYPREIWYHQGGGRLEHDWALALSALEGCAIGHARFGASDCECPTHLWYFGRRPAFERFRSLSPRRAVRLEVPKELE